VLSFDSFNEAIEEREKAAKEVEESKKKLQELEAKQEIRMQILEVLSML
jgi:hypothetical protein